MTRQRREKPQHREKPPPPLYVLSEDDCADLFGKGDTWFRERTPDLEEQGFPKVDPLLDGRNACLVEEWFRNRQPAEGATASAASIAGVYWPRNIAP